MSGVLDSATHLAAGQLVADDQLAITGGLAAAQEFYGTLEQGWEPYRIDEATLARVRRVFGEQAEDVELFAEQLRRWQAATLSVQQRQKVVAILELADELKDNTVEALLRKSDLQVGIEALLGQEPHRRRRRQES